MKYSDSGFYSFDSMANLGALVRDRGKTKTLLAPSIVRNRTLFARCMQQQNRVLWQKSATGIDLKKKKSIYLTLLQADAAQFGQQSSEIGTQKEE